jgi:hypothetical protein
MKYAPYERATSFGCYRDAETVTDTLSRDANAIAARNHTDPDEHYRVEVVTRRNETDLAYLVRVDDGRALLGYL